ncbi:sigma 54 modulation/S30EA ribosomal C-terminal domain-containing protein [Streptomyces sp. FH025]|uniref:sigma 54 modulation/S30EA ribosomal C-terminal domain-containing protein n=1 Tax=Streptomyces sp. FH025 TaxID=2815937 RepID=UPI001A9FEE6B|nr:sigma 54 modulation/S30EA ribosomal C-terminal domain-containing protein [Streptomyces sp. FH025]MBO1420136.1 sigma 54 modulation/S30EA ribosomal C-terminal domain-containing protein [Streptomyces sp. FH025]
MTRLRHRPALDVRVEIRGELPREDAEYARARALDTATVLGPDAHGLRLRLTRSRDRSIARPALAQVGVELDELGPVRVQLATRTAREAVDLVLGTLAGRAGRLREQGDIGLAAAYESAYRPQFADRPLAQRRIARHKAVVLARRTPEQAGRELVALDRRFHLFADAASGRDSVVHRCPLSGAVELWTADTDREPPFGLPEAARRLWLTGRPFVCHTDPGDGRARVLYRRYDGHYGLIEPVRDGRCGVGIPSLRG